MFTIYSLASMFLITEDFLWGIIMTSAFAVCGVFFVVVGTCFPGDYEIEELEPDQVARDGLKKGVDIGMDNKDVLLSDA